MSKRKKHELSQVGEEIYKLKKAEKTTVGKIATVAKMTPEHLGAVCHGRANASIHALQLIAKKYNKTLMIYFLDKPK